MLAVKVVPNFALSGSFKTASTAERAAANACWSVMWEVDGTSAVVWLQAANDAQSRIVAARRISAPPVVDAAVLAGRGLFERVHLAFEAGKLKPRRLTLIATIGVAKHTKRTFPVLVSS